MTVFLYLPQTIQFLSVCHYITSFGLFFYNENLLTINERNETLSIINAFFDYLNKSENESEVKYQLLRNVLKGTDLYGGGENETLDMKYVNETYQYIISTTLFSHYGNITGYLAKIINKLDNVNISRIRQKVLKNLTKNYIFNDYCSLKKNESKKLTSLAIEKILNDYIWTIFPETNGDMNLIDVNYLYAMAGLKMAKSMTSRKINMTFDNYILIARRIEYLALKNESYFSALEIFSTPVLFFYAYIEREKFPQTIKEFTNDFWNNAYEELFSYFNITVHGIIQEAIESSLYYKLENKLRNLTSRTIIASDIIQNRCNYKNLERAPSFLIKIYKFFPTLLAKFFLPSFCNVTKLPNLKNEFSKEFESIRDMYFEIIKKSIQRIFEIEKLIRKLNLSRTSVYLIRISPYAQHFNIQLKNYILFAIKKDNTTEFYILRQDNSVLSLISRNNDKKLFIDTLTFDPVNEEESSLFEKILKKENETTEIFINSLAKIKTKRFINALEKYYREPIAGEKFLNFFFSFVPFYNCVNYLKKGKRVRAALTCSMEIFHYIPLPFGLNKYTSLVQSMFSLQHHEKLLVNQTISEIANISGLAKYRSTFSPILKTTNENIENIKRRNKIIKQLSSNSKETFKSGLELFFHLSEFGVKFSIDLLKNILSIAEYNLKFYEIDVETRKIYFHLNRHKPSKVDFTGLVPQYNGHSFRYFYPGGEHLFGPKFMNLFHKHVQLRTIRNNPLEIFIIPSEQSEKFLLFREINLETGKISTCSLMFDNNDMLHFGYLREQFESRECDSLGLHRDVSGHDLEKKNLDFDKNFRTKNRNSMKHLRKSSRFKREINLVNRSSKLDEKSNSKEYFNLKSLKESLFNVPSKIAKKSDNLDEFNLDSANSDLSELTENPRIKTKGSKIVKDSAKNSEDYTSDSSEFSENFSKTKNSKPKELTKHLEKMPSGHHESSGKFHLEETNNISILDAKRIIKKIYAGIYEQNITEAYEIYKNSSTIWKSLQFEDYYALRSLAKNNILMNKDTNRRIINAIYKLACKQQNEKWIINPIVLYRIRKFSPEVYNDYLSLKRKSHVFFKQMKFFSINRDNEERRHLNETVNIFRKPILFEIQLNNQIGVADLGRIIDEENNLHVIPPKMMFIIDDVVPMNIKEQEVLVIKMHDLENSREKKINNLINEIQIIAKTDTEIYASRK
ncbi:uncharacterized protein LOC127290058 [Leptopilina boulardi]|uniref:uncharacterized protein LOC127290058 n=1 Tax=Leptopilina boulardi TaxID=63433 RepID=UPI0021F5DBCB|nr:uncharacterized protein LOC127290058 [Leptopilina boulardi]